jgi:uncharacterized membrane-anchored protein
MNFNIAHAVEKWHFKHPNSAIVIALFIPVLILLSLLFKPMMTLQYGQTIHLQTVPYDPTDLFRGDYVDLFYDMNQISLKKTDVKYLPETYDTESLKSMTIYAVLRPSANSNLYEIAYYTMRRPDEPLYLKGTIQYAYTDGSVESKDNLVLNIDFGIDKYYIEENSGQTIEEAARKGKVVVTLTVYKGYGMVRGLKAL